MTLALQAVLKNEIMSRGGRGYLINYESAPVKISVEHCMIQTLSRS